MISYIRHLYYKADILQLAMDSTPRRSPRYPAELSQFPDALLHEVFRNYFGVMSQAAASAAIAL